ncbi:golgin subfamily B member 1-like isoform X2 [Narcine bancroftii]|uniref:golgin subfamily B member 1-like isoform X2 n=1 Tax=Narcine bancroftii TaxID=1343680 RepID=UPI003831B66B
MFSRLSDLAKGVNTVLQDLSGEDDGNETNASQEAESSHQSEMETSGELSEDVVERLAQTEQLVVQLKELIREKDFQLQSKEDAFKQEKELCDARLSKLKLQAKAKVASLNARIEELQKQTLPSTLSQPARTEEFAEGNLELSLHNEIENLQGQLQKQEESYKTLQGTAETMKDQLQASSAHLKQKEAEYAQELLSLREVILEKDIRFQECIQKHEEELVQLVSGSEVNKDLHQTVKSLQIKLEEKEEALLGRARVVELLQQQLNDCDREKQVLAEKLQDAETNFTTLQTALNLEKLSMETKLREMMEKHEMELTEKDRTLAHLQQALQNAQTSCAELTAQSQQLQTAVETQEKMCKALTDEMKQLQDGLKKTEEHKQSESHLQKEASIRIQELEEKVQSIQTTADEQAVTSQNRLAELEEEKGSLLWRIVDYEEVKTENECLRAMVEELEQRGAMMLAQPVEKCTQAEDTGTKLLETVVLDQSGDISQRVTEQNDKMENLQGAPEPEQRASELMEVQHGEAETKECNKIDSLQGALPNEGKEPASEILQVAEAQNNDKVLDKPDSELSEGGFVCQINVEDRNQLMLEQEEAMLAMDKNFNVHAEQREGMRKETTRLGVDEESTTVSVELEGKATSVHEEQRSTTCVHLEEHSFSITQVYSSGEQLEKSSTSHGQLEMVFGKGQDGEITSIPDVHVFQTKESEKLQGHIQELENDMEEVKAFYSKQLQDKDEELVDLHQVILDYKEETVNLKKAINNLTVEKNQLLSQVQQYNEELSLVSELKEKLTKAEELAVDEEKKNLLELENMSMQSSLLQEQLHSAENESRTKDMKIEALEQEMDNIQQQVTDQNVVVKDLQGELQEKEEITLNLEQLVKEDQSKIEELLQKLALKEQELMSVQQGLSENVSKVQQLQLTMSEKDREMAEVTEKMVVLNEDKFSLGNQVKQLKEQLTWLHEEHEGKEAEKPIGEHEQPTKEIEQTDLSQKGASQFDLLVREKDGLKKQVENLTQENEQIKRKLQAALIKRKELLKKVEEMKWEAQNKDYEREESSPLGNETRYSDLKSSEPVKPYEEAQIQDQHIVDLMRILSEKETNLKNVRKALQDQETTVGHLQSLVEDLRCELQQKTDQVNSLEATIMANQSTLQHETEKEAENVGTEVDSGGMSEPIGSMEESVKSKQMELESQLSNLEREKVQLQKKLEEAVSLRKDTIMKAQEKTRLHREQAKQQKEEYNALLENFNQQSQEKERICEELSRVKKQLLEEKPSSVADLQPEKLQWGNSEEANNPKEELPERNQHLGWSYELAESSKREVVEDPLVEELRGELEKVNNKKNDLELKLQNLENLEQRMVEETAVSQNKILELQEAHHLEKTELLKEVDLLRQRYQDTEAHAEDCTSVLGAARTKNSVSEDVLTEHYEELKVVLLKKDEEIEHINIQQKEKDALFKHLEQKLSEKEKIVNNLQSQMEQQGKEFEDERKLLQMEILETRQKQEEDTEEAKSKQQIQRKLQAALISRKENLKANKLLKEELANVTTLKEELSRKLSETELAADDLRQDKAGLLTKLSNLQEQKEKLITEVDKLLIENQNCNDSCGSLKLIIDGIVDEKGTLQREIEFLKSEQKTERSDWQRRHEELQNEYETLLQSYENVSGEIERIQNVVEIGKQEKQELIRRIQVAEAQKQEVEKQLQEAMQEQEGMKEKMRKFAKSKQQKIMELGEEIERLQSEQQFEPRIQIKPNESSERELQEELQKAKRETEDVMKELETLKVQRDVLERETSVLKLELKEKAEKLENSEKALDENQSSIIHEQEVNMKEAVDASIVLEAKQGLTSKLGSAESTAIHATSDGPQDLNEITKNRQELSKLMEEREQMENDKQMIENEIHELKKINQLLKSERDSLEEQLIKNKNECEQIQKIVSELELDNHQLKQKVEEIKKEKRSANLDKDDLEERLMNQLAELNSSIANYQQESKEHHDKISHLELTVRGYQNQIGELEEEVRQLKREKVEAIAKLQKDFDQKVKSIQNGKEGGRIHNKELQELLKEKQQEIKQLQKDCIRYQEKISGLEKTIRALEFVQQETQKSLDTAKKETRTELENCKKAQAELLSCKVWLDDAQSEVARILADKLKLKEELHTVEDKAREQANCMEEEQKKRLNLEKDEHRKELKNMQEKVESLEREKKYAEDSIKALQSKLEKKKEETNQIQANFNENLAKLAAFTHSMSSLQNDRDRIIDESKKWEIKFKDAIVKKEEEIRDKENDCIRLRDELRQASIQHEELKIKLSRTEHSEQEWKSKLTIEEENQKQMMQKFQDENRQLFSKSEEFQKLHKDCQNELLKLSEEAKSLREQIADLNRSLEKSEVTKGDLEKYLREREAELQNSVLTCEQLKSDLQNSKALTEKLHEETGEKEEKIIALLAAKEEAVANAVAEVRQQHAEEIGHWDSQVKQLEKEKSKGEQAIEKLQRETEDLRAKLRQTEEELKQRKIKLESLAKSMASLQNDRERVLSDYKLLEQRHIDAIMEKDQLIQEAATENNKLKNEFRSQQGERDDLNSENAKLNAQLVRYREDLNQVILLKDSQHKQFQKTQLEKIKALENEKTEVEQRIQEVENSLKALEQENEVLKEEKQKQTEQLQLSEKITDELKEEGRRLTSGGPVQMLQKQLDEKIMEIEKMTANLDSKQEKVAELELKVVMAEEETKQKLIDTEARYEKELKNLQHDAGIMRNETETAEERVAELARDLMETEQRLREAMGKIDQLQGQNQSFGKAMSSLQDDRDDLLGQLEKLQSKYVADLELEKSKSEELYQELSQSKKQCGELVEEKNSLSTALTAWKNNTIEDSLLARIDELDTQLSSKQQVVHDLTLELESSANQIKSFSKTVTTLQDERERLMDEVAKSKKVHEVKLGSTSNPGEVQSLRNALSSLQNDRDKLLKELKDLQRQYVRIGEETAEISQLQVQLEDQKQQIANYQVSQEQLKQEHSACQEELGYLRSEKLSFAAQSERLKEQYLIAVSDKDKQIHELQNMCQKMRLKLVQQGPAEAANLSQVLKEDLQTENRNLKGQLNDSLKELHQKELRIQKLNSKMSVVFEEKIALSAQVRATTQNLRDMQQRLNELQSHCVSLEQQLQVDEKEKTDPMVDTAPGGPQEKNRIEMQVKETEMKQLKQRLIEAKQIQDRTMQQLSQLEGLLSEEQEKRLAAEEALLSAEHQLKSVELNEWVSTQERNLNASALTEHSLLIDLPESATPSKTRRNSNVRSFCSLFHHRYRTKLLFASYFIVLHVLFLLCFTGNL